MTPEQEIWNAERAKQIIEDPLVVAALAEMEKALLESLEGCPIDKPDIRDRLWMLFCTQRKFKRIFQNMMDSGKLAQAEIEQKSRFERVRQAFR